MAFYSPFNTLNACKSKANGAGYNIPLVDGVN
jgi:hypothetical protein